MLSFLKKWVVSCMVQNKGTIDIEKSWGLLYHKMLMKGFWKERKLALGFQKWVGWFESLLAILEPYCYFFFFLTVIPYNPITLKALAEWNLKHFPIPPPIESYWYLFLTHSLWGCKDGWDGVTGMCQALIAGIGRRASMTLVMLFFFFFFPGMPSFPLHEGLWFIFQGLVQTPPFLGSPPSTVYGQLLSSIRISTTL